MMQEFVRKINQEEIRLIDVREEDEFESGRIPHAINMPLSKFLKEIKKLDKQQHYYIVCQSGSRSLSACDYLARLGYKVTNVMGGTSSYPGHLER